MLTAMFDAPTRVRITLEDGTVRDVVACCIEVVGAVKARRPAADAGAAPKNGAAPEVVARKPAEPVDGDEAKAWLRGELDAEKCTPDSLGVLLAVVGFLRRQMFKLDVATMTTDEAKAVRKAWLAGAKPSAFCRAVVAASRDPFFAERGDIRVGAVVTNLGRLSKVARKPSTTDRMNAGATS